MHSFDRRIAMTHRMLAALAVAACLATATPALAAETPRDMYNRALAQERVVRDAASRPTLAQMRRAVAAYAAIVRTHPTSGYCDNALWQAGTLAELTYERFGNDADRRTAVRLFTPPATEGPANRLVPQARSALASVPPAASASTPAPGPALTPPAAADRDAATPASPSPLPAAPAAGAAQTK